MVRKKPIEFTNPSLAQFGVTIENHQLEILRCLWCDCIWAPAFDLDGRFYPSWWRCPDGDRTGANCWERGEVISEKVT